MLTSKSLTAATLLVGSLLTLAPAFASDEPPSPVNATYIEPSSTKSLKPNEKISHLFMRNQSDGYILQRLNDRTYFFQRQHYATTFLVGNNGVLLFDPLENHGKYILQAIKKVTNLPVTTIVYSHAHFDHIGDAQVFVDAAKNTNTLLRIISSQKTADKLAFIHSKVPTPTEVVAWPNGKFTFENQTIELHGFTRSAHTDDHAAWLLVDQKVLHSADHMNPDQLPFWRFGGSETFSYYEANLNESQKLDWVFMNGGHGNIGSHQDFNFYFTFLSDLKKSVSKAIASTPWGEGVDPNVNTHAAYLSTWYSSVAKKSVDDLRSVYGKYYGFEYSTPSNAELVAMSSTEYQ